MSSIAFFTFSKVAFYPQTISVNLQSEQVTELNVDLIPIPPFPLTVTVTRTSADSTDTRIIDAFELTSITELIFDRCHQTQRLCGSKGRK